MRPIDADALMKEFEIRQKRQINEYCDCFLNDAQNLSTEWCCVEDIVEAAPTIEAEPVRHGKWVNQDETYTRWYCSECKSGNHAGGTNYCPNCGAKMDLEG